MGRPGWHIECSVMSSDILGNEFDIHGGGIDLIFPHHENEIAQSQGAGGAFARLWMHNGLLTIKGEKMAKSLGNFISIKDFIAKYKDADYLKLLFLNAHYRHPVDYTEDKIEEMKAEKERFVILLEKIAGRRGGLNLPYGMKNTNDEIASLKHRFEEAMDEDFNMPLALASLFELVNFANKNIDSVDIAGQAKRLLLELTAVFGLNLERVADELPDDVEALIRQRDEARAKRDYKRSDDIRRRLLELGVILEDTKEGTIWRRRV